MASLRVKIYLPQNYFATRSVCENRWQIKLTGFSAESKAKSDPAAFPIWNPRFETPEHARAANSKIFSKKELVRAATHFSIARWGPILFRPLTQSKEIGA